VPRQPWMRRGRSATVRLNRALRMLVLWLMILGGVVSAIVLSEARDHNIIAVSFGAGVVAALTLPRLWRWADRNE
jgi:uncharacterized membrane protein YoaK (UPF0700 family)